MSAGVLGVPLLGAFAAAAFVLTITVAGRADPTQQCDDAYRQTQIARRAGKLIEARKQALICGVPACPAADTEDCVKWLSEIDASMPTVVFAAQDAVGADTIQVRVSLDGQVLSEAMAVAGKAVPLDPGMHRVRFELAGSPPIEQDLVIRQGEKDRRIAVSFKTRAAIAPAVSGPQVEGPAAALTPKPSIAPWVVGGVGIAGLAVGGIFGGLTLAAKSTMNAGCSDATMTCSPSAHAAAENGKTFGPVATVGLVVGGLGVATSVVLFAMRTSPSSAGTAFTGPLVTTSSAGWRVGGSF